MPFPDQAHVPRENRTLNFKVRSTEEDKVPFDLFTLCHFLIYRYEPNAPADPATNSYKSVTHLPSDFEYTVLSGGITNRLFTCALPGFPTILVRLFGPHTDAVIDRKKELRVAKFISRHGVGPAVLGTFLNGRMEGYLPDTRALTPPLMLNRAISASVAKAVAALHSLPFNPDHDPDAPSRTSLTNGGVNTPLNSLSLGVNGESISSSTAISHVASIPSLPSTISEPAYSVSDTQPEDPHEHFPRLSASLSMMSDSSTLCSPEFANMLAHSSARAHPRGLWDTISNWLSLGLGAREHFVTQARMTGSTKRLDLYDSLNLPRIDRELMELKALLDQLEEPMVFCHNDLLSGNILLDTPPAPVEKDKDMTSSHAPCCESSGCGGNEKDVPVPIALREDGLPGITIIDYEYGSVNFRSFDIANHFCECCGFDCDWTQFPELEHQRNFIRTYLRAMRAHANADTPSSVLLSPGHPTPRFGNEYEDEPEEVFEARVEILRRRVLGFALASHLFWGTWAVVMALSSRVSFDYLGYAVLRIKGYFFMKARCLAEVRPVLEAKLLSKAPGAKRPLGYAFAGWGMGARDLHAPTVARSFGTRLRGAFAPSFAGTSLLSGAKRKAAARILRRLNKAFSLTGIRLPTRFGTVEEAYSAAMLEPHTVLDANEEEEDEVSYYEHSDQEQKQKQAAFGSKSEIEKIENDVYQSLVTSVGVDWDGTLLTSIDTQKHTQSISESMFETIGYSSLEEMLADPLVDVVVVSSPPQTHFSLAARALRAGKHVIVDKPFVVPSLSTPSALRLTRTLFSLAELSGTRLMCLQNRRLDGDFLTADALMHGALPGDTTHSNVGDVKWLEMGYQKGVTTKAWKRVPLSLGGGRLWDLGAHLVDQALLLFRHAPPTQVFAKALFLLPSIPGVNGIGKEGEETETEAEAATDAESHATVTLSFRDGSVAVLDTGSMVAPGAEKPRFLLVGSRATFVKRGQDPQEEALLRHLPPSAAAEDPVEWGSMFSRVAQAGKAPARVPTLTGRWASLFEDFGEYIFDPSIPSPVPQRDSEILMTVFDAILKSIRSGKTEQIPTLVGAEMGVEYGSEGPLGRLDISLFDPLDIQILTEDEIQEEIRNAALMSM